MIKQSILHFPMNACALDDTSCSWYVVERNHGRLGARLLDDASLQVIHQYPKVPIQYHVCIPQATGNDRSIRMIIVRRLLSGSRRISSTHLSWGIQMIKKDDRDLIPVMQCFIHIQSSFHSLLMIFFGVKRQRTRESPRIARYLENARSRPTLRSYEREIFHAISFLPITRISLCTLRV